MNFDKNTIIGFVLLVAMMIGFTWYQGNLQKEQMIADQMMADSLRKVAVADSVYKAQLPPVKTDTIAVADSSTLAKEDQELRDRFGVLAAAAKGEERWVNVKTAKMNLVFSTKGGMLKSASLNDEYTSYHTGEPVNLWCDSLSRMQLDFALDGKSYSTTQFYFEPSATQIDATQSPAKLSMRMPTTDAQSYIEILYLFSNDGYVVNMDWNVVGLGDRMSATNGLPAFDWKITGHSNEKGIAAERSHCSVYYHEGEGDRDYLSESGDDDYTTEENAKWIAFKQDYFTAAIISDENFQTGSKMAVRNREDSSFTKDYAARLILPVKQGRDRTDKFRLYLGPNEYNQLTGTGVDEFDRIIDYGWAIIGTVNRYCVRPLFWFFQSFIPSWGLIILLVTLVIKTVLFPITWKNFLSGAKMRVLKPELDEINKKYDGKDAMAKQQAVMALYRETGVNPFAGCIPVLIQMPILYAMFRFFPAEIVLRGKQFLWAEDLAAYDSIFSWSQDIPLLSWIYGNHVSGFTILMCASTFLYSKMSMGSQPQMAQQPGMPNMTVMMNIFTVMMLFFFNSQPSGLSLYYFIANMVSIGQMWAIRKYFINESAIRAKIEENKKKPKTKSSFMERLEEAQKMQRQKLQAKKR